MSETFIGGPRELLYEWLNERITLAWCEDFRGIGRVVNGELVGVIGFTGHNGASAQMHMAGDGKRWGSRKFLEEMFRYAFDICGYNVVFAVVPSGNTVALDIDLRVGFEELVTIADAHPDGALHFLVMRRENCRWLKSNMGRLSTLPKR
jgi:RimJ/RimL family protein N-acetyltransferase